MNIPTIEWNVAVDELFSTPARTCTRQAQAKLRPRIVGLQTQILNP